jgi:multicomponent Na+:H+ antiporter subunit D
MRMTDYPPALILLLGALVIAVTRGKLRKGIALALPVLVLADAWAIIDEGADADVIIHLLGMTLNPVHVHAATPAFATVFGIMLGGGVLFCLNQHRPIELPAVFVYGAGALGVIFAGDLVTMVVFWELMMLGSTVIVWCGRQKDSYGAGMRYFGLHAVGGVLLLIGVALVYGQRMQAGDANPLEFGAIPELVRDWQSLSWSNLGAWLVLIGMLVNVGAPPFSAWVADAYPEGSASGTVFLSAFTTKTAVFTLLVAFAGLELLIYIGIWMAVYGIVYAILENDMRRILAYSIVNQVGFMLVGIGIGTKLAIDGTTAHAFAHIIYKALLLMSAGSVLVMTGKRKCTELGGLWRTMPLTMWCAIIGALAISSFPLTSGFTTKSMIAASVTEQASLLAEAGKAHNHLIFTWFVLEAASAGVFLHAGIKYPWFVFFQKDSGLRPPDPPWNMRAAMVVFAGICIFLGIFPGVLYDILPYRAEAAAYGRVVYSFEHIMTMLGLLLFAGLSFFVLLPMLKRTETITIDFDWIWRRFIPRAWEEVFAPVLRQIDGAARAVTGWIAEFFEESSVPPAVRRRMTGTWAVSIPVLVITLVLLAYLLVYFWLLPAV